MQLVILLLLVVALGFLVLGLVASSTPLVIASLVASAVAVTAIVRARNRRAEPAAVPGPPAPVIPAVPSPSVAAPVAAAAPAPVATPVPAVTSTPATEPVPAVTSTPATEPAAAETSPSVAAVAPADPLAPEPPAADTEAPLRSHGSDRVWVLDGRPRYHQLGCTFLIGRQPEPVPLSQAAEDGFTPCALCDPDTALAQH